jgi:hypothetical protein
MRLKPSHRHRQWAAALASAGILVLGAWAVGSSDAAAPQTLSFSFQRQVLAPSLPEAPFPLRFFSGPVKVDSRGEIITGLNDDPVKKIVGAESAGLRAGLQRITKIMFGVNYFTGTRTRARASTRMRPRSRRAASTGRRFRSRSAAGPMRWR